MPIGSSFDDVLAAARTGAAWAFEVLYRDLSPAVTGYLRLHGALDPDDLASETFLAVFRGLAGFTGDEDALRSWVFTIAHRRLVDDWRRRSRRPELADDAGDRLAEVPGGDVEDDVLTRLGTETVRRVCAGLPADQRSVLLLRVLADSPSSRWPRCWAARWARSRRCSGAGCAGCAPSSSRPGPPGRVRQLGRRAHPCRPARR
ncbi:RNA polymerase sigma-70 factor, ECF subfamily [Geodermatophilus poikilotrophus]|uniref:RNA polymerase sigma-70 factor, ECF subfamily n=1 Tax=Geodermatophilus poikilotrophus TaxID=1333667 RepID=A0A1I0EXU4_9ACTN|nr:RNA polymerase sigma factor [Geodermatophilus poikilotrophus]SET49765.1 RNA polymerase sigma-70 factor, ECF subfamily [Geodermatophilus poikilotrophus]